MGCESCEDAARERMKGLDEAKQKAKVMAAEINKPVAIYLESGSYYLMSAEEAICRPEEERLNIIDVITKFK